MLEGQIIHVVGKEYAFSKFTLLNSQESFLWREEDLQFMVE